MQKCKIKKKFVIKCCVPGLSKIFLILPVLPSSYFEDITNSLCMRHIQNIPQVLHQHNSDFVLCPYVEQK